MVQLRRYGALGLLLGMLAFSLYEQRWFLRHDSYLTSADGHFTRIIRTWAWMQTHQDIFLLRWGEPLLDASLEPSELNRSPYPPLSLVPYLPFLALWGASLETIRLAQLYLVGALLALTSYFSLRWNGRGGALITLSLLSGSPLLLLTARSPLNEPVAMAAAMGCLACLLSVWEKRQQGWGAGVWLGLALLIKWLVVPVLLLPLLLLVARALTLPERRPLVGMLGLLGLAMVLCATPLELGVLATPVAYGVPALALGWLSWTRSAPESLALVLSRTLGVGLALAFPWYFLAAARWREHVVLHPGWETPVLPHVVPMSNQVLAVALPLGGLFLLAAGVSLVIRRDWSRLTLSLLMTLGLLVLLLFTGRPLQMLTGDLQGRLLLPAVVFLAVLAGEGARLKRVGPLLIGLALLLGGLANLAPRLAPSLTPLRGAESGLVLRHPDDGTRPAQMTLGWWWPGLAVAGPPQRGEARPRTASLVLSLPQREIPVLSALVDERLPGIGGEEDLVRLAATGRVVTLARGEFRRSPLDWLKARLPYVQEVILLGPTAVDVGDDLIAQERLRPLSRLRLGTDPLLIAEVLPPAQTP